jgi:hypothetical protein
VVALALVALFFAAAAHARTLTIQDFTEHVVVGQNGTTDVIESLEIRFTGSWQGIYRKIPVEYTTPQGFGYTLFLQPISITDDSGSALKYEQTKQGRYTQFKIYVPGAEDATRTVLIHYQVLDAINFSFGDHDEFYWNVTGDEWDNTIESASAHIELPEGVTGLHAIAYTGVYGSRAQDAQVTVNGNKIDIQTNQALGFRQGLTAVVGFDKGFVHPPSPATKVWFFLRSNWPLFLPIVAFFVMLWLWWTRGRDPRRNPIAVQYDPPDKLTPGECGALVDDEVAMRDITATLVDLAVKGYLTIEQQQHGGLLHFAHHNDYIFHLKKPASEWTGLRPHEQLMMAGLFEGGSTQDVSLANLQNHFYSYLPGIRSAITDTLVSDGYYTHSPNSVRGGYIGVGAILGVLGFVGAPYLAGVTNTSVLAWMIAGVAVGVIICTFGWFMPTHTETGERALEKVLGFEDFLGRVESDKIQRIEKTPEMFEKYLPYAMALRVDKKWVQAFSGIAMQPPQWYQGYYGPGFAPFLLVNDLNMMSMQTSAAMVSAPRSSMGGFGGSGFGGGGGSGGGMGGGGGGGF